jgi:hypothetical protein
MMAFSSHFLLALAFKISGPRKSQTGSRLVMLPGALDLSGICSFYLGTYNLIRIEITKKLILQVQVLNYVTFWGWGLIFACSET